MSLCGFGAEKQAEVDAQLSIGKVLLDEEKVVLDGVMAQSTVTTAAQRAVVTLEDEVEGTAIGLKGWLVYCLYCLGFTV